LIRKFIDPKRPFVLLNERSGIPKANPFDMYGVEFSHHGDDCTSALTSVCIGDNGIREVAEMIHDGTSKTASSKDGVVSDR